MKRSEMVHVFEKCIADILFAAEFRDYKLDRKALADRFLQKVENMGMLPPVMEFEVAGQRFRDCGWEPEDD